MYIKTISVLFAMLIPFAVLAGDREDVLRWSPDGRILAVFQNNFISLHALDPEHQRGLPKPFRAVGAPFSWSSDGKSLAYVSDEGGSWDIWVRTLADSSPRRLTRHPAQDTSPLWRPWTNEIIFLSLRDHQPDLYAIEADTGKCTRITNSAAEESCLCASQRGYRMAFLRTNREGMQTVCLLNPFTWDIVPIVNQLNGVRCVRLSPDGAAVVWQSNESVFVGWLRETRDGTFRTRVKLLATFPSDPKAATAVGVFRWHPTSRELIFAVEGAARTMSLRGATKELSLPYPVRRPVWSPTGKRFACIARLGAKRVFPAVVGVSTRRWLIGKGRRSCTLRWMVEDASTATLIAEGEEKAGRLNSARDVLERAVAGGGEGITECARRLASLCLRAGEVSKAISIHKTMIRDKAALARLRMIYRHDFAGAESAFAALRSNSLEAQLLATTPRPLLCTYSEAIAAIETGDHDTALHRIREAIATAPRSDAAGALAARIVEIRPECLKQPKEALKECNRLIDLAASWDLRAEVNILRASILSKALHENARAVALLQDVVGDDRSDLRPAALEELARLYENNLEDFDSAVGCYERLIEIKFGARDAAKELSPACVRKYDRQITRYVNDAVRLCLKRLGDAQRALSVARRLPGIGCAGTGVDTASVIALVRTFDETRHHQKGNALLREAVKAAPAERWASLPLAEFVYLVRFVSPDVLADFSLAQLPNWLDERVQIALEALGPRVQDKHTSRELMARHLLEFIARWGSWDMKPLAEKENTLLKADPSFKKALQVARFGMGNYFQTQGNVREALRCYERAALVGEDKTFLAELRECESLLDRNAEGVKSWLDAEREAGWGPWRIVLAMRFAAETGRMPDAAAGDLAPYELAARARGVKVYGEFLQRFGRLTLADDAAFRLALMRSPKRQPFALVAFAKSHPDSPLVGQAIRLAAVAFRGQGRPWLEARLFSSLADQIKSRRLRALVLLAAADGYGWAGKKDEELTTLRSIASELSETDGWSAAMRRIAEIEHGRRHWGAEARVLECVLAKSPMDSWVANGDAALALARCYARAGKAKPAASAYVVFIRHYRMRPDVRDGTILAEAVSLLSDGQVRELYAEFPKDFAGILHRVDDRQVTRLLRILSDVEPQSPTLPPQTRR